MSKNLQNAHLSTTKFQNTKQSKQVSIPTTSDKSLTQEQDDITNKCTTKASLQSPQLVN